MIPIIQADWPAPVHVRAFTTTRIGGVSVPPYDTLNVAAHVDDHPAHVAANRAILREKLQLPSEPVWLAQAHTTIAVEASAFETPPCADASFTRDSDVVCVSMTADCLPVLVCDKKGTVVSAIHAGWKGLAMGILPLTLDKLGIPPEDTLVWLAARLGQMPSKCMKMCAICFYLREWALLSTLSLLVTGFCAICMPLPAPSAQSEGWWACTAVVCVPTQILSDSTPTVGMG